MRAGRRGEGLEGQLLDLAQLLDRQLEVLALRFELRDALARAGEDREVDERIAIPRKPQPVTVAAGSIGIAGKQTGIYPLASPGGWQIIGRTPLKLFDAEKEDPTLLKAGDTVQFISISKNEFENY